MEILKLRFEILSVLKQVLPFFIRYTTNIIFAGIPIKNLMASLL